MPLSQKDSHLLLHVKVVPNSRRTQLAGILGTSLKIKIAQPPEDNRANTALLELLAKLLQIPISHLSISAGHTRPQKTICIQKLPLPTAQSRLGITSSPPSD